MSSPQGRILGHAVKRPPAPANDETSAIRAEDATDERETAREAREEAERLGAAPWARVKKEEA